MSGSLGGSISAASTCPGGIERVIAVVVTFEPQPQAINTVLATLAPQVAALVIVDNGSCNDAAIELPAALENAIYWIRLGENRGIAAAQNRGIQWAREQHADYVLLCDQDSEPAPDMVTQLITAARCLVANGVRLALVAPSYVDARQTAQIPFMHLVDGRPRWFGCTGNRGTPEITTAIASGALIPLATIDAVGGMLESLFIDLVDIEWCFRARAHGFRAYGVCAAKLSHSLGEQPKRVLGRMLATHSPLRNYYFYRNAIWLFRQGYVPAAWKLAIALQMLKRYLVFPAFVPPRRRYLEMMTRGLWHGLRGRGGAL
ncbi:MAG: glycosyltransferase family 2 protein [Chromatiaceae bacterium]|nr:MAG: glycosyltransferase family 2 protein [Chromatiaceae bacterium]